MNTSKILWITAGLLVVVLAAVTGYFLFNKLENDQPQIIFKSRYSDFDNVLKKPGAETQSNKIFEDTDFNILAARDFISKDSWKTIFTTGPSIQLYLFKGMFLTALFDDDTRAALNQINASQKEIDPLNISQIDSSTIGVYSTESESILHYTRLVRENGIWKFDFSNLFSKYDKDKNEDDLVLINKLKNPAFSDFLDWLYVANNEQIESFKGDLLVANMDNNNPLDNLGRLEISKLDNLLLLSMQLYEAEIAPISGTAFGLKGKYSDVSLVIEKKDKSWTILSMDRYKQKSGNLSQKNTNSSDNKNFVWVGNYLQLVYENNTGKFSVVNSSDKNPADNPRLADLQKQPFKDFMEWLYVADEEGIAVLEKSIGNAWNGIQDPGERLMYFAVELTNKEASISVISETSFSIDEYGTPKLILLRKGNYWLVTQPSDR